MSVRRVHRNDADIRLDGGCLLCIGEEGNPAPIGGRARGGVGGAGGDPLALALLHGLGAIGEPEPGVIVGEWRRHVAKFQFPLPVGDAAGTVDEDEAAAIGQPGDIVLVAPPAHRLDHATVTRDAVVIG